MKYLKTFNTESSFDAAVMKLDKAWVTFTEDNSKAHFMDFKTGAAWVGGGEADCVLGDSEEYVSESPVELYKTKKLTTIKFPAEATELISLETEGLKVIDLSECDAKSPIIWQVKETVGDDVEVIVPPTPTITFGTVESHIKPKADTIVGDICYYGETPIGIVVIKGEETVKIMSLFNLKEDGTNSPDKYIFTLVSR